MKRTKKVAETQAVYEEWGTKFTYTSVIWMHEYIYSAYTMNPFPN